MGWRLLLCEESHAHKLGHEPLDKVAMDLKHKIYKTTKSHDALFSVKCLGDISLVDLHLLVGTSPYDPKLAYNLKMSRRASNSEL
jgi:hypothetical protein